MILIIETILFIIGLFVLIIVWYFIISGIVSGILVKLNKKIKKG